MIDGAEGAGNRWERVAGRVLWGWLGLTVLFALLAGLVADGCPDATCDTRVQTGWVVLVGFEAAAVAAAAVAGSRLGSRARLLLLAGAGVASPLAIAVFLAYASRYV
ncbi:MAG: hypothetical protein KQH83_05930 [Actinobacteria bacterium]|nr:hypothetical protein [Actinomycetota bacterium]